MKTRKFARRAPILGLVFAVLLVGCGGVPRSPQEPSVAVDPVDASDPIAQAAVARILAAARSVIGVPYRYGGATPAGFDCSGLVLFTHKAAALSVPRTAAEQARAAVPVAQDALLPGDLVFFRVDRGPIDHVGVYAGDGRFVHAPRTGRSVGYASLEDPWYAARYAGAGRFWSLDTAGDRIRNPP